MKSNPGPGVVHAGRLRLGLFSNAVGRERGFGSDRPFSCVRERSMYLFFSGRWCIKPADVTHLFWMLYATAGQQQQQEPEGCVGGLLVLVVVVVLMGGNLPSVRRPGQNDR